MSWKDDILVVNAGSSSIKFAVFDSGLKRRLTGGATGIGGASNLTVDGESRAADFADHREALRAVLGALKDCGIRLEDLAGAGHRVVHGGARLTAPRLITPDVRAEIEACEPLAPLHNPHNLAAIDALGQIAPQLAQTASFDTGFHANNPAAAKRYAIPDREHARGIRRYGFHGTSYGSLAERLPEISGEPLPDRLLALHLGNGASLCAIRNGRSVATTMGYSPVEGLTMGTRCGEIDANAVLRLAEERGIDVAKRLLNDESGLLALGGHSDMRALREADTPESRFAIGHFVYWAVRHAGSMIAAMEGLDAVAFTGGIGENDVETRAAILAGLGWAGAVVDPRANAAGGQALHPDGASVAAWVVPADEERRIARDALSLLRIGDPDVNPSAAGRSQA